MWKMLSFFKEMIILCLWWYPEIKRKKKMKLEHIDNLKKGKKSGTKIGSRGVPHHLFKYEEMKYERALKNRFLEITTKDRVNLQNLWEKVCIAKNWKNLRYIQSESQDYAEIFL
jgi:hypothetical protein